MTLTENNNYPIFEADQVLTSKHLNDSFEYLEEQQRLSRVKLIGMGISCGLDIHLADSGASVLVSSGVAVTSNGYLIPYQGESSNGSTSFPYFTPYSDPNEDSYPFFLKGVDPIPLFQLRERRIQGAEPLGDLPDGPITNYGVLLYLECFDKKLKNCIENDCDEKGTERIFTLRILLVHKRDLRDIICREKALNSPKTEAEIDAIVNARFRLKSLNLPRIKLDPSIISAENLIFRYNQLIDKSYPLVYQALANSYLYFQPILEPLYTGLNSFAQLITTQLPLILEKRKGQELCHIQSFYDLLFDLTSAYNEFADAAFGLWTACCPSMEPFPKHIRLGHLTDTSSCEPSPYRTRFLHAPNQNGQRELSAKVQSLHLKMYYMIEQFDPSGELPEIRITPSRDIDNVLSRKAIPAYYKPDNKRALLQNWNPELKRRCRQKENLSYHADQYATRTDLLHIRKPLDHQLHAYNFFRIEGHYCQNYRTALAQILNIRKVKNLAFDVITLRLGTDASGTSIEDANCVFQDLETICEAWKKEAECLLSKTINGVTGFKPADVFAEAAPAARDTAGFSFKRVDNSVLENTKKAINTSEGFFGRYVAAGYATKLDDPCKNSDSGIDMLKLDYDYSAFTNDEFQIAVQLPMEVSIYALDYARIIDENCAKLDIDRLETSQQNLLSKATAYESVLRAYQPTAGSTFHFNQTSMLEVMTRLIHACSLEQMKVIKSEMDRRKAELQKMNLFSEYVRKNPGIDHAGGVPKGGTFIMVHQGGGSRQLPDGPKEPYFVSGSVFDFDGAPAIGASVIIKGTSIGAVTDLDGRFRLQIPGGTVILQAEMLSGLSRGRAEILVSGPSNNLVINPGDKVDEPEIGILEGKVVADFYLPYLCCSDCPPVAYVLPGAESVGLSIKNNKFCLPVDGKYTGTIYPFSSQPADAEVSGEGVIGTATAGYSFDPNTVNMGSDIRRELTFTVNGESVPLTILVEKQPKVQFTAKIFWMRTQGGSMLPHIQLQNDAFNAEYTYQWHLFAIDPTSQSQIRLPGSPFPASQDKQVLTLDGQQPGTKILILLSASGEVCENQGDFAEEVPEPPVIVELAIFNQRQVQLNTTKFRNSDGEVYIFRGKPGEGTFSLNNGRVSDFISNEKVGKDENDYSWTPEGKTPGTYIFRYTFKGVSDIIQIEIVGPSGKSSFDITRGILTGISARATSIKRAPLFNDVLKGSQAYQLTTELVSKFSSALETEKSFKLYQVGESNEYFAAAMKVATNDMQNILLETAGGLERGSKFRLNKEQNFALDLYKIQFDLLLTHIAMLSDEIDANTPLAKLLTHISKQLKTLIKQNVIVKSKLKFNDLMDQLDQLLQSKPQTKKRIDSLLSIIK